MIIRYFWSCIWETFAEDATLIGATDSCGEEVDSECVYEDLNCFHVWIGNYLYNANGPLYLNLKR
jgi:hypothetical protein